MASPRRSCTIDLRLMRIDENGFHLMVKARVSGKVANLLIDTGASQSVFDSNRIKRFVGEETGPFEKNHQLSTGLGTNSLVSHFATLRTFTLGGFRAKQMQVIILDLAHINQSYGMIGLKPIDGVIGSDLLHYLKAQISYRNSTLKIYY